MKQTYSFHTYVCKSCSAVSEEYLERSEVEATLVCEDCKGIREFKEDTYRRPIEQANVPINFIEQKQDGSYRVTRLGRKKDIHND